MKEEKVARKGNLYCIGKLHKETGQEDFGPILLLSTREYDTALAGHPAKAREWIAEIWDGEAVLFLGAEEKGQYWLVGVPRHVWLPGGWEGNFLEPDEVMVMTMGMFNTTCVPYWPKSDYKPGKLYRIKDYPWHLFTVWSAYEGGNSAYPKRLFDVDANTEECFLYIKFVPEEEEQGLEALHLVIFRDTVGAIDGRMELEELISPEDGSHEPP
jgi:hypothetical protein